MSKVKKILLRLLLGAGLLILAYYAFLIYVLSVMSAGWSEQMDVGIAYMESLTEDDVPYWIGISQDYLAQPCLPDCWEFLDDEVPADLRDLGIIHVRIYGNDVYYGWLGGMEHTHLLVSQESDGSFSLIAHHNDEIPSKVLWSHIPAPKAEEN